MSGRCSDNPAAIDNVREFDSTVKEINFNIPYKVEVDSKQWVEGNFPSFSFFKKFLFLLRRLSICELLNLMVSCLTHKENGWTKPSFDNKMNSIMSENFSFDNQGVQDIASLLGTSDSSTLKIIEEGEYLNSIKRKLMDYASSKYALNNAGFKSQG
jgi:hypothetical protein